MQLRGCFLVTGLLLLSGTTAQLEFRVPPFNRTAVSATQTTEANQWRAVTFGNNLFVAVASDGANRVMTSPDTITWTHRAAAEANQWSAITFGNNLFVAVASDGTNRVMSSSDAITWIARAAAEANQWRG